MTTAAPTAPARRVPVFFYGSFIRPEVMARGGLVPERIDVARLPGFDIRFTPHACLVRSAAHAVCGILVQAMHEELQRLYSADGVGVFLPEAVLVETGEAVFQPALCFIPPAPGHEPPDLAYLDLLIAAARGHGFPAWYLARLEQHRSAARG
jgi:hypothetical protein